LRLIDKLHAEVAALCTHGDVIEGLIKYLAKSGVDVDATRLEKGAIWVLDVKDNGEIVGADYIPAPA
jgi:hypothetical protein